MKHILIAGVSGAIGHALAVHYLNRDEATEVIGLCRNPDAVEFDASVNQRVQTIAWDAADEASLRAVAEGLSDILPAEQGLDAVIYAAGILHSQDMAPEKRLEDLRGDSLARAYAVNASGYAVLMKAVAPWLRHKRFKTVVAISAKVGSIEDNGFGGWYAYRSSKAALNMLVRNFAIELPRKHGPIACIALHPGTTLSPLSEPFSKSLAQLKVHEPEETAANLSAVIDDLTEEKNGAFLSWDGTSIPW